MGQRDRETCERKKQQRDMLDNDTLNTLQWVVLPFLLFIHRITSSLCSENIQLLEKTSVYCNIPLFDLNNYVVNMSLAKEHRRIQGRIYKWASMGCSPRTPKLEGPPSAKKKIKCINTGGQHMQWSHHHPTPPPTLPKRNMCAFQWRKFGAI